jgi:hypothetical protein
MLLLIVKTLLKTLGEVYSIQYYVIKFVSDLRQVVVLIHCQYNIDDEDTVKFNITLLKTVTLLL